MAGNKYRNYTIAILTFWFLYALIRYVIFKDVSPSHIPLYILNKALALTATTLLLLTLIRSFSHAARERKEPKQWGIYTATFAAAHTIMSLLILSPGYFSKHFNDQTPPAMNLWMELSMMFAVVSLLLMFRLLRNTPTNDEKDSPQTKKIFLNLTLLAILLHVTAIGWQTWFEPQTWAGYMPPLTLWGAILAVLGLIISVKSPQKK